MDQPGRDVVAVRHAPSGVGGSVCVPASKSLTQRALVAAALAGVGSEVRRPLDAEDPRLLFEGLRHAGFRLSWQGHTVAALGRQAVGGAVVFMGNNGTGVRFLLAQLAGIPGTWLLDGSERLRQRPIAPLVEALRSLGAKVEPALGSAVALPLKVFGGRLAGGEVALDASVSSQFVSALLLLGAVLPKGLAVRLAVPPPSRPYLDLTAEVLAAFGAEPTLAPDGRFFAVSGGGLTPAEFTVEGDWSAAAFPLAAAAVAGGEVEVEGVRVDSRQGDAAVLELLAGAGCVVRASDRGVVVRGPATRHLEADLRDTPDLFPALSVVVARVGGTLTGLEALAAKESDRLEVMARHLIALGFPVEARDGWFVSLGGAPRMPAPDEPFDPAMDHRVAMALAVAGCAVSGVRVLDPGCVAKSWPAFWTAWQGITTAAR
jgi:3-phosphoshikimate 1-carboxyvinyltransferase